MKLALLSLFVACAHPAPVAPTAPPVNYAYNYARASFPTADIIPVGERTAFGRDGLRVIVCIEADAAHHSQCVALADYTPKEKVEEKKPDATPAAKVETPPAKPEAPKKK